MFEGDRLLSAGDEDAAARVYANAGREEVQAFDHTPADRRKTRGMLAISAVGLLRRGKALDEAIHQAHAFLARYDLPDFAQQNLDTLLDDMRTELAEQRAGWIQAADQFEWVLRGPRVGSGIARSATVGTTIDRISRFGVRVIEFLRGVPVRKTGQPDRLIQQSFDLMMTEPAPGSFRFGLRFSVPTGQLELFPNRDPIAPEAVGGAFAEIVAAAQTPDPLQLEELVPDPGYRDAFLRLVRILAPDGKELSRVEIRHVGTVSMTTVLTRATRRVVTERLRAGKPSNAEVVSLVGALREVDLERNSFLLSIPGEPRRTCRIGQGIVLLDVADALLDHRVSVTGRAVGRQFVVTDVVEAETDEE
jgi:hypothetical protein